MIVSSVSSGSSRTLVAGVRDLPFGGRAEHDQVVHPARLDHVGDDHRDVVDAALGERDGDQLPDGLLDLRDGQGGLDLRIVDQAAHAVTAEHQPVAGPHLDHGQVGIVGGLTVEHLQQQGSMRVVRRLGLADLAFVDQRLHPAVIMGESFQLAVAEEVGPAVADVGQAEFDPVEHGPGEGGAHPVEVGIGLDEIGDPVVGLVDRAGEHFEHLLALSRRVDALDGVDRDRRSKITGRRTAHAVGDHQQTTTGEAGVLVVLPDQADLGMGGIAQLERHRLRAPASRSSCRCGRCRRG